MFFQKIKEIPRNIKYGIESCIKWAPIIWKDRNWDQHFIYVILRHKLYLTEQIIRKHGHYVDNKKDADNIKICINILDRFIEDKHCDIVWDKHYKKWGYPEIKFTKCNDKNYNTLDIVYPGVKNEKDKEKQKREFKSLIEHEENMKRNDLDYLFKFMAKHIREWWD
jgi:hypothetical protein